MKNQTSIPFIVAAVTLASILLIILSIEAQQLGTADVTPTSPHDFNPTYPPQLHRDDSFASDHGPGTLPGLLTTSAEYSGWLKWTAPSGLFSIEFPDNVTIASDDAGGCLFITLSLPEASEGSRHWAHVKLYPLPSQCGPRIFNSLEAQTASTLTTLILGDKEVLMVDSATDGTEAGIARVRAFYRKSEFVIVVYDELVGIPGADVRAITDKILSTLSSPEQ